MKKAAVLFWSQTGNTEKVAVHIKKGLEEGGMQVILKNIPFTEDLDFFDFDLICLGTPSYNWHPPKPVDDYLKKIFNQYKKQGKVKVNVPTISDKYVLIFCTYSGPHTGIREALPVGKYVGQFFEHLGFTVIDDWYILSEFHGSEELSTMGRMGNIKGLPTKEELERITDSAKNLALRF